MTDDDEPWTIADAARTKILNGELTEDGVWKVGLFSGRPGDRVLSGTTSVTTTFDAAKWTAAADGMRVRYAFCDGYLIVYGDDGEVTYSGLADDYELPPQAGGVAERNTPTIE